MILYPVTCLPSIYNQQVYNQPCQNDRLMFPMMHNNTIFFKHQTKQTSKFLSSTFFHCIFHQICIISWIVINLLCPQTEILIIYYENITIQNSRHPVQLIHINSFCMIQTIHAKVKHCIYSALIQKKIMFI